MQHYKVADWVESVPHVTVEFDSAEMFININSSADLKQAEASQ